MNVALDQDLVSSQFGLSKELRISKEKGNVPTETVYFKLISAGKIDPATKELAVNAGVSFEGVETIVDGYEEDLSRRLKIVYNIGGFFNSKGPDGNPLMMATVSDIEFGKSGILAVQPTEINKLLLMRYANYNADYKFRDRSKTPLWVELKASESKEEVNNTEILSAEAVLMIGKMDMTKLKAACQSLTDANIVDIKVSGQMSRDIKNDLINYAKKNPKTFIENSNNIEAKLKVLVMDAELQGIISFETDKNTWVFTATDKAICSVEAGDDITIGMLKHFASSEGRETLNEIKEALDS